MTSDPATTSSDPVPDEGPVPDDGPAPDEGPGADAPPARPSAAEYDLRKRLRVMGAVLAGGVAALLAVVLWLGVAVPAQQEAAGYNDADRVYAQVMAEHHAQVVELAALAPGRGENPEVLGLVHEMGTTAAEQADALAGWMSDRRIPVPASVTASLTLAESGGLDGSEDDGGDGSGPRAPAGGHAHGAGSGHGMLTPEQIDRMARLRGEEFDAALVDALIEHHQGGLQPVDEQLAGGTDADVTALATAEKKRIRAELDRLGTVTGP